MSDIMPASGNRIVVEVEMNLRSAGAHKGTQMITPPHPTLVAPPSPALKAAAVAPDDANGNTVSVSLPKTAPSSSIPESAGATQDSSYASNIDQIFSEAQTSTDKNYSVENDDTLQLAATLLQDAKSHRFLDFKADASSHRMYKLYYRPILKWIQYLAIFLILGLAVIEEPAVWPEAVPYWACSIIELASLSYLGFRVISLASFQHKTDFWKDKKNAVAIILITLSVIDIVCYSIWKSYTLETDSTVNPIRWSRPLRPLFVINFPHARQIRRAFRNIRRTVVEIVFVLILFLFSVSLFALLAYKLFSNKTLKDRKGQPYFSSYLDALWSLYVLVTTANNPDVTMPAYDESNWYALFFIIFLVINLYVFMNVLLAVIFNSYKRHLKNEVKDAVFAKRRKLASAYDLVKEKNSDGNGYYMSLKTWSRLMSVLLPKKKERQVAMLFQVMDGDGDGRISKAEFLTSADLLNVPLTEVKDRMILWDRLFPKIFNSRISKGVRLVVLHKFFRYFFDLAIAVNAVFIARDITDAEWFFLALFTLEILLKLYAYGPRRFIAQFWNVFDVIIIGGAMITTIVEAFDGLGKLEGDTLDFILVIRVLRLIKIVNGFDRFRVVITTVVNIGPSIIIYGGVLFVFYYSFAIIGMEIFNGTIHYYGTYDLGSLKKSELFCGNKALNGSEFWDDRYCSNNFNDIAKAFVVLSELTVVNQWHVLTSGFVLVTHPAARVYFLLFHLFVVVLIMNIFIAFILEAFILEYSLSKSKFESQLEAKILQLGYALGQKKLKAPKKKLPDSEIIIEDMEMEIRPEEGTRFHIRQTRRKVEVLLQRMFEDELEPDDLGMQDDLANEKPPRKFTFDWVGN